MPQPGQLLCGAKNRAGGPCRAAAMANGRCANHGGKSTGPPLGSKNGRKHGIYDEGLTEEELALEDEVTIGSVDAELKVLKFRLRRALIAEQKWLDNQRNDKPEADLVVTEVVTEIGKPEAPKEGEEQKPAPVLGVKRTRKISDFDGIIHRITGRIAELERVRNEIGGGQSDFLTAARRIKEAMAAIDETVPEPIDEAAAAPEDAPADAHTEMDDAPPPPEAV